MKLTILLAVLAVLAFVFRPRARSRALTTLRGIALKLDSTQTPEGCIDAFEQFAQAMALCKKFRFTGPEFGFGDLAHFRNMAEHSLTLAIQRAEKKVHLADFARQLREKLPKIHTWKLVEDPNLDGYSIVRPVAA